MILFLSALLGVALLDSTAAPPEVVVTTPRGEERIAVRQDHSGAPVLPAPALMAALNGTSLVSGVWGEVAIGDQPFRFLLGAPVYVFNDKVQPLGGMAYVATDTLFLPFQFVAEILPKIFTERYRYDAGAARLVEMARQPSVAANVPNSSAGAQPRRLANGLLPGHAVTIDPGHGGADPGNPGLYFPRGVREKNVTLQIGRLLRDALERRGVGVIMTRNRDTLIDLYDRGRYCTRSCDLFVSLHVNSLARRSGYTRRRGFETYFLAEARTEDAARVERMENEAVRYETSSADQAPTSALDFILKDLQLNEHLRESARVAELMQNHLGQVHSGEDRGVRQAGFIVLTTARRPAVLVELGYSTNPEDAKLLTTPSSQKKLAESLADAVVAYLLEYERKTGASADSGGGR